MEDHKLATGPMLVLKSGLPTSTLAEMSTNSFLGRLQSFRVMLLVILVILEQKRKVAGAMESGPNHLESQIVY